MNNDQHPLIQLIQYVVTNDLGKYWEYGNGVYVWIEKVRHGRPGGYRFNCVIVWDPVKWVSADAVSNNLRFETISRIEELPELLSQKLVPRLSTVKFHDSAKPADRSNVLVSFRS